MNGATAGDRVRSMLRMLKASTCHEAYRPAITPKVTNLFHFVPKPGWGGDLYVHDRDVGCWRHVA